MERFNKFISEDYGWRPSTQYLIEGSTEAAKEMEYLLVHVSNGRIPSNKKKFTHITPYAKKHGFKNPEDLGKQILKNAGISGISGSMVDNQPVNKPTWRGNNTTPKTDIIIDRKKISLKKGSSQLMSGGPAESGSTFEVAASKTKGMKEKLSALAKECEEGIENLMPSTIGTQKGGADDQRAAGTFDKDKILKAADDFNIELKEKFRLLFKNNVPFAKEFVFEAMTGKVKFDDNEGTATHFLVVDFDGDGHLENVITSADAYVSKILPRVNPEVRFKSSAQTKKKTGKTGFYNFRSVVQLSYTAQSKAVKEVYDMVDSGELQYLSEGFFDAIKRAWNKAKTFIKNLWDKVKKWISSSVNRMMDFLEIKPQITMTNEITW